MHDFFKFKIWTALAFVILIIFCAPEQTLVNAEQGKMVNELFPEDPNVIEDEPAQNKVDTETAQVAGKGIGAWDYIKMLFSLIFVLALLLFILKFINRKNLKFQQNNIIQNIGGVSLGSQKSVQLIQIGNSIYIVGVGENIQLIKEINDPEEIEKIIEHFNERQTIVSTTPYISEIMKKLKSNKKNSEVEHNTQSFGEIFNKRLSDIKDKRSEELEKLKEKEHDK